MSEYNFNFFQIPHTGLADEVVIGDQQSRGSATRVSNFGALAYGVRDSLDYTKLTKGFKAKDELQNPDIPYFLPTGNGGNWGNAFNNPYALGSTTHKVRNDELYVMLLGSRRTSDVQQPGMDVMDTYLASDTTVSGMALNFPKEGYKSFGLRTGGPFEYRVSM